MSNFGLRPFGTESPFGGPGSIAILGAATIGTHEILVDFDVVPETFDPAGWRSATNPANWSLTPIDPRIPSTTAGVYYNPDNRPVPTRSPILIGVEQDAETLTQVVLQTDSALEVDVQYDLEIQPVVEGLDCENFVGITTWRVDSVASGRPRTPRLVRFDLYRDWALDFFPTDPRQPEGTWRVTAAGDIAIQGSAASLRKRILRRVLTEVNAFAHLVGYGTDLQIKSLLRTTELQRLANAIPEQIRLEPDVREASCTVRQITSQPDGSFLEVVVNVIRDDATELRYPFEIPVQV